MIVLDKNGLQGTIYQAQPFAITGDELLLVHFENGQQVLVPGDLLSRHEDGSYRLSVGIDELLVEEPLLAEGATVDQGAFDAIEDGETLVIPITQESIKVQKRIRETGIVEIHKTVHQRNETVDLPLQSEEVEIERITINRMVDQPIPVRHEGDTMIISLLEEVLVIEKRLVLREEVHIKKLHKEVHAPQEVLLREEQVEIVRKPGPGQGSLQE